MSLKAKLIIVGAIILVIVGAIVFNKVSANVKERKAKNNYENSFVTGNVSGTSYSFNSATVSDEIYEALHSGCLWGLCEYEQDAVTAINNTPKAFMQSVVDAYLRDHKLDLKSDCIRLMSKENFNKVRAQFM